MSTIIIVILWGVLSTLAFMEYADACADLSLSEFLIVSMVFIIGGPFFAISNILTAILECILPEGWDNDDDFKGH